MQKHFYPQNCQLQLILVSLYHAFCFLCRQAEDMFFDRIYGCLNLLLQNVVEYSTSYTNDGK